MPCSYIIYGPSAKWCQIFQLLQELTHNRTAPGKEGELIETILAFLAIFNL